ncbi:hypothetical protein FKM82_005712 [Ascaphus truei]
MRTRKHQSPVEPTWVDKHTYEAEGLNYEAQAGLATTAGGCKAQEAANGGNQYNAGDNSLNVDQKKINGKKQKRRRRSPKTKGLLPEEDCALAGLLADKVWFEKYVYDDAECAYYTKLATDQAKALEAKPFANMEKLKTQEVFEDSRNAMTGPAIRNCCHGSMVACHHVDNGIWVNKLNFDDAEGQFVIRFVSPLASHSLALPLVPHRSGATNSMQRTPDEGYGSATPTPAAHDLVALVGGGAALASVVSSSADPTVNGKPHLAGLQDLVAEVWLEKPLYDQAERSFYENIAISQSAVKTEPQQHWNYQCGKKGKRDKWNRKSVVKRPPAKKRELPSIPEEAGGLFYCPVYFLHGDSESAWLDKPTYDKAETRYYEAQATTIQQNIKTENDFKLSVTRLPRPTKYKHHAKPRHPKKMAATLMGSDNIWFDKFKYDDAERQYYEQLNMSSTPAAQNQQQEDGASTILRDIARARENIQKSLAGSAAAAPGNSGESDELVSRVANLELENQTLNNVVKDLQLAISKLESRLTTVEKSATSAHAPTPKSAAPVPKVQVTPAAAAPDEDDDDDIDLFGSDEEEEDCEAAKIREERVRQYAEKKSTKPGLIAKSSILLDVKPWDDETDMAKLEECVRTVQMDGLLWGSSKLLPVGYGIKKLQIQCVVEDDKVGTDMLEEEITKFEDYVQSVDIAAFNKI